MAPSRSPIIIGSVIIAMLVVGGIIWNQRHSDPAFGMEESNPTPNANAQPNPKSKPPKNSNDPLLNAIQDQGSLKAALETLQADASFDAEGQLYRLGLDRLPITDAGLKQLEGLKELKILMLTGSQVSSAGVDALRTALPNCVILF